jgi:hypothetical protein
VAPPRGKLILIIQNGKATSHVKTLSNV